MKLIVKLAALIIAWSGLTSAGPLDDLLNEVRQSASSEAKFDAERKASFLADKNQQQKLLTDTKAQLAKAEAESKALREQFAGNQTRIKELDTEFKSKSGDIGNILGMVRDFAGKLNTDLSNSIVSAQYPGRSEPLEALALGKVTADAREVERLWFAAFQEMAESGKSVKFRGKITDTAGNQKEADIYRIGVFSALANDRYLRYIPKTGKLEELAQQPDDALMAMAKGLRSNHDTLATVAVDPSRGTVLDNAQRAPAEVAWVPAGLRAIMSTEVDVGIIGLLLLASIWAVAVAFERWHFYRQVDIARYATRNELETDLTRNLIVIGTVAANAPFIGLLGTVLGIMLTFHKMGTERGMDVHHIMIGLSVALKATAMGLVVAIPCVVLNNVFRRRIRELVTAYEVSHGS